VAMVKARVRLTTAGRLLLRDARPSMAATRKTR